MGKSEVKRGSITVLVIGDAAEEFVSYITNIDHLSPPTSNSFVGVKRTSQTFSSETYWITVTYVTINQSYMDSILINEVTRPYKCVILSLKGTSPRVRDNISNLVTRFILNKDDEGEYEQIDLSEFKNEDYLLDNGTISSDFIRPIGPGILVLIDTAAKHKFVDEKSLPEEVANHQILKTWQICGQQHAEGDKTVIIEEIYKTILPGFFRIDIPAQDISNLLQGEGSESTNSWNCSIC